MEKEGGEIMNTSPSNNIIFLSTAEKIDGKDWELSGGVCKKCSSLLTRTTYKDVQEARKLHGFHILECIPCNRRFYTNLLKKHKQRRKKRTRRVIGKGR